MIVFMANHVIVLLIALEITHVTMGIALWVRACSNVEKD